MNELLLTVAREYGPIIFIVLLCFVLMHKSQMKNIDALKEQNINTIDQLKSAYNDALKTVKEIAERKSP